MLRRFLLHVLPSGFVRIRYFAFLANCHAHRTIDLCRQLLQVSPTTELLPRPPSDWKTFYQQLTGACLDRCPVCQKGRLVPIELLIPDLPALARSPPAALTPLQPTSPNWSAAL